MTVAHAETRTTVDEIADGIFRISTPRTEGGGFTYNRFLIVDDEPLLFHTGPRAIAGATLAAVAHVMPVERLRHVGVSHFEGDECGAINELLAAAPEAAPLCGRIGAMTSVSDLADRPARPLADGEALSLGRHTVRWYDTPHLPHGWDCGYLMDETTGTLFCGDLFTQPGADHPPVTEDDILGPSEDLRSRLDYFAHAPDGRAMLERLAGTGPRLLACMHGASWAGDGGALLRALADRLEEGR